MKRRKPIEATATEAMAAMQAYRTYEEKLQREIFVKITEIFQAAYLQAMENIRENLKDMTPPARGAND